MKKVMLFLLLVVIASVVVVGSCGEGAAPSPAPAPAPAPSPAPAPPPEKIEIIYTDHAPPGAGGNVFMHEEYVPRLKAMLGPELGDRIEFVWYHASSLFPYGDQINAVEQGLADICTWVASWEVERAPLNEVVSLPFMGWPSAGLSTQVWEALEYNVPEFAAEYEGFVVLGRWNGLKRYVGVSGGPANVPADYKGKSILASGVTGDILASIGASPLQQPPSDWYTSLDRGLADGILVGMSMYPMFNLTEVLDYAIAFPSGDFGYTGTNWVMSEKKFKSLPIEMQGALMELRPFFVANMIAVDARETAKGINAFIDTGGTLYTLTQEEEQAWFDASLPFHEKWIADGEAKGLPTRMVYDECMNWIDIYTKGIAKAGIGD